MAMKTVTMSKLVGEALRKELEINKRYKVKYRDTNRYNSSVFDYHTVTGVLGQIDVTNSTYDSTSIQIRTKNRGWETIYWQNIIRIQEVK